MSANYSELNQFIDNLQDKLNNQAEIDAFCEACVKELAARLLRKVIRRTPVGKYPHIKGKTGGTLRRGWTCKTQEEAESKKNIPVQQFLNSVNVSKVGNTYRLELINPVEYAPYVEYGHRTSGGNGWVNGRFMLTISEQELNTVAPKILEAKLSNWLKGSIT